jgi:hypothetical protein
MLLWRFSNSKQHGTLPIRHMYHLFLKKYLKTFEEQVFSLEFMEPDDIDDEDAIVEDVAKAGKHNQPLPEELQ